MFSQVSVECLVFTAIITSIVVSLSTPAAAGTIEDLTGKWLGSEFSVLQKVYDDCQDKNDFTGCLKGKALVALTKAVDQVCDLVFFFLE